jgi:hypothetical protein
MYCAAVFCLYYTAFLLCAIRQGCNWHILRHDGANS